MGVDPEVAAEDACRMEHVISSETFDALKRLAFDLNAVAVHHHPVRRRHLRGKAAQLALAYAEVPANMRSTYLFIRSFSLFIMALKCSNCSLSFNTFSFVMAEVAKDIVAIMNIVRLWL